ncbi:MAG: IPT/TIG domain-containing protein [Sandaracinaceae bacterium]|nr:IPT/TIG domain-containing protein [Sandaracinaceae bacterium]
MGRFVFAAALSMALLGTSTVEAQVRRPMPVVQRIEPTSGPPGTLVALVGRYFDGEQTVFLGSAELTVQSRLPNRWTVTIPPGAASGEIEIRTPRGNVRGPRFRVTEAAPAPVVSGFAPTSGAAGTEVLLRGENFSPRVADNYVHLGDTPVVVRTANPTELRVIVPEGATSAPFRVRVTGAGEATSSDSFTIGTGTSIAGFEPAFGPPGTHVTIRGTGFDRRASRVRVYLGDERVRVLRATETELEVEVPRRGATSGRWLVDVTSGGRAYSAGPYDVRYAPVIASMDPQFGAVGVRVTLTGEHFGDDVRAVTALLGETPMQVRDIADDHLVLEIPEGASSGAISVTVNEMGPVVSRAELRVVPHVAVDGFTPRNGGAGTEVTIHGRGFATTAALNTVTLSGQSCEVVRAAVDALVIRVPEANSGPLVVTVQNAGEARTRQPFVVTDAPTIASVSPPSGAVGTEVTITGTNFGTRQGLIDVRLGDHRMDIRRSSDTELVVTVPPGAQSGRIRVTVRLQGTVQAPQPFTVPEAAAP